MDRRRVERWIAAYEKAWRSSGTDMLPELFAPEVEYLTSPWAEPIVGLEELARFWEAERQGPGEAFSMDADVVAVELETAVIRVDVEYESPPDRWRNLWVVLFAQSGRCMRFEEWPFSPGGGP